MFLYILETGFYYVARAILKTHNPPYLYLLNASQILKF